MGSAVCPVELPASLTIADVAELYAELSRHLLASQPLELDGSQVEMADTAGLQLLAALFSSAAEKQIPVAWRGSSEVLCRAALQVGLASLLRLTDDARPA